MRHPTSSKFNLTSAYALATCMLLLAPFSANAALTISSTRIIQPSDRQSTSIVVANPSNRAYAAQAWINTEADDSTTAVPLIASPALFRIDPASEQTVQFNRLPNDLPKDRESLFFFNLQEIPQANDKPDNVLNIALRTRIKVFFRPSQLKGRPQDHLKNLTWSVQSINGKPHLVVDNPSPYYFTFNQLTFISPKGSEKIDARKMAIPLGRQTYPLKTLPAQGNLKVDFTTINDYGAITPAMSSPARRS
ncbi:MULTISPECIES: fimbrial biogenesis chaperone [Pseudomonas]|uniref:Molecular chaperone n=2 Tax=Pseudomonas TaxID=286 RepID=A0A3M8SMR3_PSEPU|nr:MULTISPECIES: molecular chaperone [Pseudomonas]MDZ5740472.1 molecular chaperone [Pseudomonas asiatica]MDZ5743313.1 molecular chaperone [Pseudomonas asiatica]MDZ5750777.1 molecular chaperone [Pseudomonas asiatica]MDZ5755985.1 molecular chaperone [Pseudomonas asiatica]RNF82113.1 molecular chaperone [Pseudomonas putida]